VNVVDIVIRARDLSRDVFDNVGRGASRIGSVFGAVFSRIGQLGDRASQVFQRLGGTLGRLGGTPHGALVLIGATLAALPILAQAVAIAITLGIGGALAGLGIMVAAKSKEVQAHFAALKAHVSGSLKGMAQPFENELVRIANISRDTFDDLAPSLGRSFSRIAPMVTSVVQGIGKGLSGLGSNIDGIVTAFGPLMNVLARRMPDVIAELGNAFEDIAHATSDRFLDMLIDGFIVLVRVVAGVIEHLAYLGDKVAWVWEQFKKIPGVRGIFEGAGKGAQSSGNQIGRMGNKAEEARKAMHKLAEQISDFANKALDSRSSMRNLEKAIDDAAEAARKNGRTLDINTRKGRDNQEALDGIARAAHQMAKAVAEGGGDAGAAMSRARERFIATARSMGMSQREAERLADDLGLVRAAANRIPTRRTVNVRQSGIGDAIRASKSLASAVRSIPTSRTVTVRVRSIASNGIITRMGGRAMASGGVVGRAAEGGPRSNLVLVGELGPELVDVAPGSTVIPHGRTQAMLAGARGGGPVVLEFGGAPSDPLLRALWEWFVSTVRIKGGTGPDSVQRAVKKG
jgi:phage-related protein